MRYNLIGIGDKIGSFSGGRAGYAPKTGQVSFNRKHKLEY